MQQKIRINDSLFELLIEEIYNIIISLAYLLKMGQNLCSQVDCCRSVEYQQHFDNKPLKIVEDKDQEPCCETERQNEASLVGEKITEKKGDINPEGQQTSEPEKEQSNRIPDLQGDLNDIPPNYLNFNTPKEIYLSIDDVWKKQMKKIEKPMDQYYTKITENEYVRNLGFNNKFQMLFHQHLPILGVSYFQINVPSYLPKNGCELIVGVVDYFQAVKLFHCKGSSFEQSFTFQILKDFNSQSTIQRLETVLRVEVNRQTNMLNFYIDDQLEQSKELKPEIMGEKVSLVPFLQTQILGVTFGWKESPFSRLSDYKMSTIVQEQSSIYVTQ